MDSAADWECAASQGFVENATLSAHDTSVPATLILDSLAGWALPAVALMCTVISVHAARHYLIWGSNKPGPSVYPFVGFLPGVLRNHARLYDWLTELLEQCPSLTFRSAAPGGLQEVYTANPQNLQHILKDNFENYPKGEELTVAFRDFLGHGIFNSDGEAWRQQRKTASLEFSTNSLRSLIQVSVKEELQTRLFPVLDEAARSGAALDVQDALLRFSFDNICRVGFGVDPGCLSPAMPTIPFAKAFDVVTQTSMKRVLLPDPIWKTMQVFDLGFERTMREALAAMHGFVDDVIRKRMEELQGGEGSGERHTDLLSRFILLSQKSEGSGSVAARPDFLRDITINFILAGRDTSSLALTWIFWNLGQHSDVEQRVLEEVEALAAQRGSDPALQEATFSYDELRQLTYTTAVINESLRLYPVVPMDFKTAAGDDVLPDGTKVRKGARMNYVIYAMGRMEALWGPDAKEFKPERWIGPDGQVKMESPFKFSAFNAGPRLCLGKDMAYVQMRGILSSVIRRYKLRVVPGHKVEYGISLTMAMKHGLKMTVEPRYA